MRNSILLLSLLSTLLLAQPSFNAADIATNADGAFSVHVGDLDGDGDMDGDGDVGGGASSPSGALTELRIEDITDNSDEAARAEAGYVSLRCILHIHSAAVVKYNF